MNAISADFSSLVLQRVGGKDASKQFWKYHNAGILKKYKGQLLVGSLDSKKQTAELPTPPATPPPPAKSTEEKETVVPSAESGTVAPMPGKDSREEVEALDSFGDLVPYGDPSWYQSVRWQPANARWYGSYRASTVLHISTRLMPRFVPKYGNGSIQKSNPTSRNGMRPKRCRKPSTSKWANAVI